MEPLFDEIIDGTYLPPPNSSMSGPIYIFKENDIVSEQTFVISIIFYELTPPGQIDINEATIGDDIQTTSNQKVIFSATEQQKDLQFILLADNIPEGTEALFAGLDSESSVELGGEYFDAPTFSLSSTLNVGTFIKIIDDDRKFQGKYYYYDVLNFMFCYSLHLISVNITIGFEQVIYTVNESVGQLEVYVSVSNPPGEEQLFVSGIDLVIQTISLNASECFQGDTNNVLLINILLPTTHSWRIRLFGTEC